MAQLVHNIMCVSLRFVSSGVMLWLFIGLIGSLTVNDPLPEKSEIEIKQKSDSGSYYRRILQIALILVVCSYLCWIFARYFHADIDHNRAIFFSKARPVGRCD